MKKLFLWVFLISNVGFCQFFDSTENSPSSNGFFEDKDQTDQQNQEKSLTDIIFGIDDNSEEGSGFFVTSDDEYEEPEQGEDAGGNPADPVPIDNWLLILPIAASIIVFRYLYDPRKRETASKV
ncbi:MAG: hypothetical protein WBF83_06410 [Moheibacter sp.]